MTDLNNIKIKIYTVSNVADLFMVNEETIRKFIKEGKLNAISQGAKKNGYIILGSQLQNFMNNNTKYKDRYDRLINTVTNPVEEVSLRDYILKFLYNKVPYEVFKSLYDSNARIGSGVRPTLLSIRVDEYISREDDSILRCVIAESIKAYNPN